MKKKILAILLSLLFLISLTPIVSIAQSPTPPPAKLDYSGWVQCDGVVDKTNPSEKERNRVCDFVELINTAKFIINWAFMISIPIIIGLLAYSGFLYMTGSEANMKKAKGIMWNAVFGFVIMLCAWFLVTTGLKWLLNDEYQSLTGTLIETQK